MTRAIGSDVERLRGGSRRDLLVVAWTIGERFASHHIDLKNAGDVLVLAGIGPMGTGMEETYQVTSALKQLPFASRVALITDPRFSGVSTGACIGHVGPEALAGGPIGKLVDGDRIAIVIDTRTADGSIDLVGHGEQSFTAAEAVAELATRSLRPDLAPDPHLPDDTRLWAALQQASGGTWAGCVYDPTRVARLLARRE